MPLRPRPTRPRSFSPVALALLAIANVAVVAGAGYWATSSRLPPLERINPRHFATEVEAQAAAYAAAIAPLAESPERLAAEAIARAPKGARVEVALLSDGRSRVIASSDASRVEKPPAGDLGRALAGEDPAGRFENIGLQMPMGARYTAYHQQTLAAAPAPSKAPTAAPTARATARWVEREVIKEVPAPARPYTIKAGDTLYQISREHFGHPGQFLAIYTQNKAIIGENRARLPVGSVIQVPGGSRQVRTIVRVLETPAPAPTALPAAVEPSAAPIRRLAIALSMPQAAPIAPPPSRQPAPWPLVAAAAGTAGLWWLASLIWKRHRRQLLADQREGFLSELAARITPKPSGAEIAQLRSPWRLEVAASPLADTGHGGSFVDLRTLSESRLGIFLGSASGVEAASLLGRGMIHAFWRARAGVGIAPGQTLREINRLAVDFIPQGEHVTAFYAQIDTMSGALSFASAAHTGAYLQEANGELSLLAAKGLPLGVGMELFSNRLIEGMARLREGERLWLFTDGVIKAENAAGEPFGLERLEGCLKAGASWSAERLVDHVRTSVWRFVGKRGHLPDAAIACFRLAPISAPAEPRSLDFTSPSGGTSPFKG